MNATDACPLFRRLLLQQRQAGQQVERAGQLEVLGRTGDLLALRADEGFLVFRLGLFLFRGVVRRLLGRRLDALGLGLAVVGLPVTAPLTIAPDETIVGDATQTAIGRAVDSVMGLARRRGAALGTVDSTSAATLFPAWRRALVGRDEISLVPVTALVEE